MEGYFFNDLVAFDLNALQIPGNQWEVLIPNTTEVSHTHGPVPPARTNHTIVNWNDKLFLCVLICDLHIWIIVIPGLTVLA